MRAAFVKRLQSFFVVNEPRATFRAIVPKWQVNSAVLLAPKAGPKAIIKPHSLIVLIIGESWVAACTTSEVEEPKGWQEIDKTDGIWPKYV